MKSRISIDFDFDNNTPIIKIDYIHSDDLRDKHVKMFLEKFGSISSWARIRFNDDSPYGGTSRTATLTPITPEHIKGNAEWMTDVARANMDISSPPVANNTPSFDNWLKSIQEYLIEKHRFNKDFVPVKEEWRIWFDQGENRDSAILRYFEKEKKDILRKTNSRNKK